MSDSDLKYVISNSILTTKNKKKSNKFQFEKRHGTDHEVEFEKTKCPTNK